MTHHTDKATQALETALQMEAEGKKFYLESAAKGGTPVLKKFSIGEFKRLLKPFKSYRIVPERFPVKTKLHKGWKARVFNDVFVGTFNFLPKALVKPLGWHLMAFATK